MQRALIVVLVIVGLHTATAATVSPPPGLADSGEIEVHCPQPGAQVSLDGQVWFTGPGIQKKRVPVGDHVVTAEHSDFVSHGEQLHVVAGGVAQVSLGLVPLDQAEYRFRRWIPWAVVGAGVAIAAGGLGVRALASNQMADYDARIARECETGCDANLPTFVKQYDRAQRTEHIAVAMVLGGGAITVGGIVLLLVNRPIGSRAMVDVTPTPGGATAHASWQF